ncbi:MAG TPA: N-acetylmuramic acid 6-phosphate etherase [Phycisphaerae bacterium]|nr:N-acetylmuramic acid 6-phosphate etherase [Phycisphaerae bacterium]
MKRPERKPLDRGKLTTERENPRSREIDRASASDIVRIINAEDALVAPAVARERVRIAKAVDVIADRLRGGGRLFYVGAGTSGRLGVLDASECPPTFGTRPSQVQGVIAGGRRALVRAVEGAEDHAEDGARALAKKRISARDVVVGIAACGLTPYVHGALDQARAVGATTIFVTCSPQAVGHIRADIIINPVVGPEVVTGSTRMKAGTATKLVLNTLTTGAMIRLGKTCGNLMVDLRATNEKLRDRSERIVCQETGVNRRRARALLDQADGLVKVALVMALRGVNAAAARSLLEEAGGMVRKAIGAGVKAPKAGGANRQR